MSSQKFVLVLNKLLHFTVNNVLQRSIVLFISYRIMNRLCTAAIACLAQY